MISLYDIVISNEDIKRNPTYAFRRFNLSIPSLSNFSECEIPLNEIKELVTQINWIKIDFKRSDLLTVPTERGIYMFCLDPYSFTLSNHSAELILYIGMSGNLRNRLCGYPRYENKLETTDLMRRMMIVLFGQHLKIKFCPLPSLSRAEVENLEYLLNDTIIPPFSQKFRTVFANQMLKLNSI